MRLCRCKPLDELENRRGGGQRGERSKADYDVMDSMQLVGKGEASEVWRERGRGCLEEGQGIVKPENWLHSSRGSPHT